MDLISPGSGSLDFDFLFRSMWWRGISSSLRDIAAELRELLILDFRPAAPNGPPALYEYERDELVALLATS